MPGRGRPSKYTPELAAEICRRLANGETLRAICRDEGFPPDRTVRGWAMDEATAPGFGPQYASARNTGMDAMADQIIDLADTGDIERARLQCDVRKWFLCKLAPKRYGERVEIAGDKAAPLAHRVDVVFLQPSNKDKVDE